MLLPDTDRDQGRGVAEKLRVAITAIEGTFGALTASIGVAPIPLDAGDPETLLRTADRAMYTAKRNGRDQVALALIPETALADQPASGAHPA